jgi:hypothetical protein
MRAPDTPSLRLLVPAVLIFAQAATTCSAAPDAPKVTYDNVMRLYAATISAALDAPWEAPADPCLSAMTPARIRAWLDARKAQDAGRPAGETALRQPASRLMDLGRAAVALAEKDRAPESNGTLLDERLGVLNEALDVVLMMGEAPLIGLHKHIDALATDYPREERISRLQVRYVVGLPRVANQACAHYGHAMGVGNGEAFVAAVTAEAETRELAALRRLLAAHADAPPGDLAAIYIVARLWTRGDAARKEALDLATARRPRWRGDAALEREAAMFIRDVLAQLDGLGDLAFRDASGKVWGTADLRGKTSLFFFLTPGHEAWAQKWEPLAGPRLQVFVVPMAPIKMPPGRFIEVERAIAGVTLLRDSLNVHMAPDVVVLTPDLRTVRSQKAVVEYMQKAFPDAKTSP